MLLKAPPGARSDNLFTVPLWFLEERMHCVIVHCVIHAFVYKFFFALHTENGEGLYPLEPLTEQCILVSLIECFEP